MKGALHAGLLCGIMALAAGCSDNHDSNASTQDMSVVVDMPDTSDMEVVVPDMPAVDVLDMPAVTDAGVDMTDDMGEEALVVPEGCNPVAFEHHCFFPYPSNVFLHDSDTTPSGKQVVLTDAAKIKKKNGNSEDFLVHHPADGFSHHQPIAAAFGVDIDEDNLIFHTDDLSQSLDVNLSPTLLIRADTGEPVAHWAEVDRLADKPEHKVLFIRPLENLDFETRYIAIVKGIKTPDGEPVKVPEGFAQIKAGDVDTYPEAGALVDHYTQDIFPVIEDLGVNLDDVQLAWDFTTQTEESVIKDMVDMRDDLMVRMNETPPAVTVTAVKENISDEIALRIEGTLEVPLYLEEDILFPELHRDETGKVAANGTHQVPFTLQVPTSAIPESGSFEPARLMQYGHGFFGSREEINYSFMRGFSQEQSYVTASVDWRGMSSDELAQMPGKLTGDVSDTFLFVNGVHQGVMNFIALSHALKTTMTEVPELKRFGKLLYNPDDLYYYGISQGQILGAAFLALSPHVKKAVLSVGGGPFSFMMGRSNNFSSFVFFLDTSLKNRMSIQQFMTLSQHTLDRVDPSTYSKYLLNNRFDGGPEDREILMHLGYWDHSVPILSGLIFARNAGFDVLLPSPHMPYGLSGVDGPVSGSALTLYDFNLEDPPGFYPQLPTDAQVDHVENEVNVHESIRRQASTKAQIDAFLQVDGVITHTCDGPCDPE